MFIVFVFAANYFFNIKACEDLYIFTLKYNYKIKKKGLINTYLLVLDISKIPIIIKPQDLQDYQDL